MSFDFIQWWCVAVTAFMVFCTGGIIGSSEWESMDTDDRLKTMATIAVPFAVLLPIFGRIWGWF